MKSRIRWSLYLMSALLLVFSSLGPVVADEVMSLPWPHLFFGGLFIGPEEAPAGTEVEARDTAVLTGIDGNPITTEEDGKYGGPTGFDPKLIVQGYIDDGTPIEFYVDGVRAECREPDDGPWQDTFPWHSDGLTELDLRVPVYTLTVASTGCCTISVEYTASVGEAEVSDTVAPGDSKPFPDIPRDTEVHLTAETVVCCALEGWEIDGEPSTENPITVTMDADYTAVATCSVGPFTLEVNVDPEGMGHVDVSPPGEVYTCCTTITLTAVSDDACWEFEGWSGAVVTTTNPMSIHMDSHKVITATFALKTFTLEVAVSPEGGGDVQVDGDVAASYPTSYTLDCGTEVTLTAVAADCYDFVEWTGALTGTVPTKTIHMDEDKSVTAVFSVKTFTLEVAVSPEGGGDVQVDGDVAASYPTTYTLDCCTEVTLTAVAAVCYEFVEWTGALTGTVPAKTIHMDEDKSVTATFSEVVGPFTLTVTSEGCCEISVEYDAITDTVAAGESKDIPALPCGTVVVLTAGAPLCGFNDWQVDGSPVAGNPIAVTMEADHTAVATCSPYAYTLFLPIIMKNSG